MNGAQFLSGTAPKTVKINFESIPDYAKEDLAAAAFHAFMSFMTRPEARAILDAEREMLMREGSTLLDPR